MVTRAKYLSIIGTIAMATLSAGGGSDQTLAAIAFLHAIQGETLHRLQVAGIEEPMAFLDSSPTRRYRFQA
jgi:hypothetical protein